MFLPDLLWFLRSIPVFSLIELESKTLHSIGQQILTKFIHGLRQANLVLIAYASSEGSGEPALAHTSSESRGTFRQKARSLAPLNGWACAVEICHDGMLEDTNSLDGAQMVFAYIELWPILYAGLFFIDTMCIISTYSLWNVCLFKNLHI